MLYNIAKNAFKSLLSSMKTARSKHALVNEIRNYGKSKRTKKMPRHWQSTAAGTRQQEQYKLLSYNILAQDLLTEHIYLYYQNDPTALIWEERLYNLRQEIESLGPDILCLQEIQYNHLRGFVQEIRGERSLEYVFKKKTGKRTDGCAIVYDKAKFRLLEDKGIEYYTPGSHTLNRENIAIMAKFNLRNDPTKHFIVATTHLLYNPKRHDVRIDQIGVLMAELSKFSVMRNNNNEQEYLPIILTGDFNSEPHSPPFKALTNPTPNCMREKLDKEGVAPNGSSDEVDNDKKVSNLVMSAVHFGKYGASTFQEDWIVVDYILHSTDECRDKIQICCVYNLPTVKDCYNCGPIPNRALGSDHFSLAITFSVLKHGRQID